MYLVLRQYQADLIEATEAINNGTRHNMYMSAKEKKYWAKQARTAKKKLSTLLKEHPEFRENVMYEETV